MVLELEREQNTDDRFRIYLRESFHCLQTDYSSTALALLLACPEEWVLDASPSEFGAAG